MTHPHIAQINSVVDLYLDLYPDLANAQPVILATRDETGIIVGLGFVTADGAQFCHRDAHALPYFSDPMPPRALIIHMRQEFPTADDMPIGMTDERRREGEALHISVQHAAATLRRLVDAAASAFAERGFGALSIAVTDDLRLCAEHIADAHRITPPTWIDRMQPVKLTIEQGNYMPEVVE
jgi:hypothetical protein